MAESAINLVEKGMEDLEKEITCAICHEHYTEPKVLSCCHYYCKQCIRKLALRTGLDKPFSCPECRKETTLPHGSMDNLQIAFFVNRLEGIHSKLEKATGKVEVMCEICSEDKAEAYCHHCAQFICAECEKSHKRMKKAFLGHKIVTINELIRGGAKEIIIQEPARLQTCKWHEQPMNIYCFTCSCLICRDCTIKDHHGHNWEFVKKAAVETKEKLDQLMEPLICKADGITTAIKNVRSAKSKIASQGKSIRDSIETSFEELHQILEERLRREATEEETFKLEPQRLSSQEESLSTTLAAIQSVVEFTKQCMKHSTNDEMMIQRRSRSPSKSLFFKRANGMIALIVIASSVVIAPLKTTIICTRYVLVHTVSLKVLHAMSKLQRNFEELVCHSLS